MSAARRLRDLKPKRLAGRHRFLDELKPLDLLKLAHGLRRLGRHRAKPVHKFLQCVDLLLLIFMGGHLLFVTFLPLPEEVRVIAGVGNEFPLRNLMHLGHDFIHELAVMRNEEQRA